MKDSTYFMILMYATEALSIFFIILALTEHELNLKLNHMLNALVGLIVSVYFHTLYYLERKFFKS